MPEEEFQTCVAGVLSELKTKPKNLAEEHGRYSKEFSSRSYDFARRGRLIARLESGVTREQLLAFLHENVQTASRLYVQVRKVLEKEDKALPEGATIPDDPPGLRKWTGYDTA